MTPEIQIICTIIGFIITVYGFYSNINQKSILQANKINTLEIKNNYLENTVRDHNRRLDDHDKQNQSILLLAEQIKNLSDDVRELKKEIKKVNKEQ